ncbi:hypothetical protein [Methylobacterium nonmethylotrophicum]|uniref:Uncharacterized protein n=1 Tax=Methylobacterium nonmethylotrophicum TaxID=1141884 RepID=A0A4Z0NX70_9HYPH|nr:hypothetical protein [Methylobacterium nonmethylotrophicum]TGE02439.1 hypothetical protein EU555_01330 [Methylobacterium nonmethylotrophicum]
MVVSMHDVAKNLRGILPHANIDARRLVLSAKNPSCVRLRAILMSGIAPATLVHEVFGFSVSAEQSGFALRQGSSFEAQLYANGAARLIASLQDAGLLGPSRVSVLNINNIPGLNSSDARIRRMAQRSAIKVTEQAIAARAAGRANAPNLILQANLRLSLGTGGEEVILRPDVLYARGNDPVYRVGEAKSFSDLAHLTDEQDVATAAAQAGVYTVGLEEVMRSAGVHHTILTEAALIFRRPGSMNAVTTLQSIDRDIATARRMLAQRPRSLSDVVQILGPGKALDQAGNVLQLPSTFMGGCRSFCPLWQVCLNEARAASSPRALGTSVEELVGAVGSVRRARELMHGAPPGNPVEADIQRRLQEGMTELQRAVA